MAPINTHYKDKDCSALVMLTALSPEAVSNPCACGGLLNPCVSDRTNTHALLSPDAIAHVIAITPASAHVIRTTPELAPLPNPSVHNQYAQLYNHNRELLFSKYCATGLQCYYIASYSLSPNNWCNTPALDELPSDYDYIGDVDNDAG
eukprot:5963323-Ditylum_brightwellii.AAC.1